MSFTIRKAGHGDVENIAELWYEMSLEQWNSMRNPIYKPKPRGEFLKAAREILAKKLKERNHLSIVALTDGKVIGFILARIEHYRPSVFTNDKLLYVKQLFVVKNHRRKSIGTNLMKYLLKEAGKRGVRIAYLSTWIRKKGNLAFYEGLGFKKYQYRLMKVLR